MKNIITLLLLSTISLLQAAPGDTTRVLAHSNTDMTWYGNYDTWVQFPDQGKTYHKILLNYTMGCATGGCSDWDYTTQIMLMHNTGRLDSNVAKVDTISTNPLVTDTTWNVFEVKEPFELARVITPYGGSLPNSWNHTFVFDVTDYYPLLKDSVELRAFYAGWSSGFSATTEFIFIEGTPPRTVLDITGIYKGYKDYRTSGAFESEYLHSKTVDLLPSAQSAMLRVIPTGHGFVNALNCAEFCERDYYVNVNNQRIATQVMWRDDCGLNPIWPQAGTWLYDRANWCPGGRALHYDHDLTAHLTGSASLDIDVDVEPYTYTVPSGQVPAGYYFTGHVFQYGATSFNYDVALKDILAPSNGDEFGRMNPICGKAIIEIQNRGGQNLTSCTIEYGMEGGNVLTYNWTGNLGLMETEIVEIDIPNRVDWETYTGSLHYRVSVSQPNGQADENSLNNAKKVSFTPPPVYPPNLKLILRTNNQGSETFWSVRSADGTVVASGDNLLSNTSHQDTFTLSDGCYELLIGDRDKDGLTFFANNDGTGSISLRNNGGSFFNRTFNPNFGTENRQYFTVGLSIGQEEISLNQQVEVYPNPAAGGIVTLEYYANDLGDLSYTLLDQSGKALRSHTYTDHTEFKETLDFSGLPAGLYFLRFSDGKESIYRKLLLP